MYVLICAYKRLQQTRLSAAVIKRWSDGWAACAGGLCAPL